MITFKKAGVGDWAILQNLNNFVFIDNKQYDSDLISDWALSENGKKYFQNLLNDKNSHCLIAYQENIPIGYIAVRLKAREYCQSKYLEIENMGVIPNHQSQGIGTKLINEAIMWAKQNGYQKLFVSAYFKNIKAIKFYKQSGFEEIDLGLCKNI